MVRNGYEPHTQEREYLFQIVPGLNVVTPEARQILYHNAVYLPGLHVIHKPCKLRPVKLPSLFPVIGINAVQVQIGLRLHIFTANPRLILDGIPGVILAAVLNGKPHIYRRGKNPYPCISRSCHALRRILPALPCHNAAPLHRLFQHVGRKRADHFQCFLKVGHIAEFHHDTLIIIDTNLFDQIHHCLSVNLRQVPVFQEHFRP